MDELKQELKTIVAYFKSRPVFKKLFEGFREKYASFGHFGGKVKLHGLTTSEKSDLGGFLQKDFGGIENITVSALQLEKALDKSRFSELNWALILECYFGEPLTVKRDAKNEEEKRKADFFDGFLKSHPEGRGKEWLRSTLKSRSGCFYLLMKKYREDKEILSRELKYVISAIDLLASFADERHELLPVFSSLITGDPHYFDEGKTAEKMLFSYIRESFDTKDNLKHGEISQKSKLDIKIGEISGSSYTEDLKSGEISGASKVEYRNRLYYEAGILRDDLSNDVLAYGIRAWKKNGDIHPGIEGFFREKEPVKLTLRTISMLESAYGGSALKEHIVYVVENPAIFSALINKYPEKAFILGNGQPRTAFLVLMDLLSGQSHFLYMGDFDPEGILIAQRLKERYKARLKLWNYNTEWYFKYCSTDRLSTSRLKKLEHVYLPELKDLAYCMKQEGKAAYQESMLDSILESLNAWI